MIPLACLLASLPLAAIDPPYDCFGRSCTFEPPLTAHLGRPDGIPDDQQCVTDWDRSGGVNPSDVASYVSSWYFAAQNPGACDADLDCNGVATPADLSLFVNYWYAIASHGSTCP